MAGYVGESSSQALQQTQPQEEVGIGGRWYMSRKETEENSPSRKDGIDLKKETYLRKSYCTFLQDLGMRLKVPQVTIATAIIFCHRFFLRQSHARNDRRTIATVCMFLAGKVEETPRPLKDVILVSYEIIHKKDQTAAQRIKQKEVYEQQKELILLGERVVLATLGFDLNVHHPYKPLVEAIKKFRVAQNALAQVAWNFVNDGLRTSLCLQFKPHHIAAGAIFLAAKFLKVKLPSDGERAWWQEFDVTPRQLEEVSNQMLELYEQNRVPPSQGSEIDGSGGGGGSGHRASSARVSSSHEELGGSRQQVVSSSRAAAPDHHLVAAAENHGVVAPQRGAATQSQNNNNNDRDRGSADMGSDITDHKVDAAEGSKDNAAAEQLLLRGYNNTTGGVEGEDHERLLNNNNGSKRNEGGVVEAGGGEWVDDAASSLRKQQQQPMAMGAARHLELREGGGGGSVVVGNNNNINNSPKEAIKIDKDKVKAALEKTRKARAEMTKKRDVVIADDDDDFIERALEDGVELAAAEERRRNNNNNNYNNSDIIEETTGDYDDDDVLTSDKKETTYPPEEGEMLEDLSPAAAVIPNHRKRKGSPLLKRHEAAYNRENGGDDGHRMGGGRSRRHPHHDDGHS